MEDKDFNEVYEYALWKGFSGNQDFKEMVLHIDKVVTDYDFTLDLVKELIKSLYSDTEGHYDDKKDLDEVLKGMIKEFAEEFEPVVGKE